LKIKCCLYNSYAHEQVAQTETLFSHIEAVCGQVDALVGLSNEAHSLKDQSYKGHSLEGQSRKGREGQGLEEDERGYTEHESQDLN